MTDAAEQRTEPTPGHKVEWFASPMALQDNGPPITDHEQIVAGLEMSVRKGSGLFWGVHDGSRDDDSKRRVVAHTGNGPNGEKYARLIAAAFNAATAAEDMGYDGQAAVEALPKLLQVLKHAKKEISKPLARDWQPQLITYELVQEIHKALASCRAKESGT